jgi:hypothetical protein
VGAAVGPSRTGRNNRDCMSAGVWGSPAGVSHKSHDRTGSIAGGMLRVTDEVEGGLWDRLEATWPCSMIRIYLRPRMDRRGRSLNSPPTSVCRTRRSVGRWCVTASPDCLATRTDGSFGSGSCRLVLDHVCCSLRAGLSPSLNEVDRPVGVAWRASGHPIVASESALAEIERLIRLDFPAMSETDRSSIESSTRV